MSDDFVFGIGGINSESAQDENAYRLLQQTLSQLDRPEPPAPVYMYELHALLPGVPDHSWLLSPEEQTKWRYNIESADLYDLIRQARQAFFEGYHAVQIFRKMPFGRTIFIIHERTDGVVTEQIYQDGPTRIICNECGYGFSDKESTSVCPQCQTNDHIAQTRGEMVRGPYPLDLHKFGIS